jgi:hypothetical protein
MLLDVMTLTDLNVTIFLELRILPNLTSLQSGVWRDTTGMPRFRVEPGWVG